MPNIIGGIGKIIVAIKIKESSIRSNDKFFFNNAPPILYFYLPSLIIKSIN